MTTFEKNVFRAITAGILGFTGIALLVACTAGKVACTVIGAADQVCTIVEFPGPDGAPVQEPVPASELRKLASTLHTKRLLAEAGAPDAGTDDASTDAALPRYK